MTTSPAPDVDRVLDRMGRSAFGYRSFPRPDPDAGKPHQAPAPMAAAPTAAATAPAAASAPVHFPLITEALPGAPAAAPAAAAPPAAAPPAAAPRAVAPAAPQLAPMPPPAAPSAAPPNPFLSRTPAAPPPLAVPCTSLAGMFRLLSGRADSVRPPADGARLRDDIGARAPAFPFRHG